MLTLIRFACRLAAFAACLALLALWVEPHWVKDKRTLELRVRRAPEVVQAARSAATRAWIAGHKRDLPAVSSGNKSDSQADELTDEDRRLLQKLVEEKLRE